jgi:hypothetical protein
VAPWLTETDAPAHEHAADPSTLTLVALVVTWGLLIIVLTAWRYGALP